MAVQGLPSRKAVAADDSDGEAEVAAVPAGLNKYYRLNIDLMVDILWIVAIVVLIIVTEARPVRCLIPLQQIDIGD